MARRKTGRLFDHVHLRGRDVAAGTRGHGPDHPAADAVERTWGDPPGAAA